MTPSAAIALDLFLDAPMPIAPIATHTTKVRAHRRAVRGEAGKTERELRNLALQSHQSRPGVPIALAYVRAQLLERYEQRVTHWAHRPESHFVTAEDADEILTSWADCPEDVLTLPTQKWRGAIFNPRGWVKTGQRVTSDRPGMHANDLACWQPRVSS